MKKILFTCSIVLGFSFCIAQFPGPAGTPGSTAMHKDSSVFVAWATGCEVVRGFVDIAQPDLGLVSAGNPEMAIGKSGSNGVVSLGDGGYAILTFDKPIKNGPGFDFAVFENAFNDTFLELAFVEVSSDGVNYFRFPATSLTPTDEQVGTFGSVDATKINNLAGKYRIFYGTPFDLEELADINGLDIENITHVKLIDVVGSIDPEWGTVDAWGNFVNDPYPTPFPTGGFDLDAVGVIHQSENVSVKEWVKKSDLKVFPNPVGKGENLFFLSDDVIEEVRIFDVQGKLVQSVSRVNWLNIDAFPGIYLVEVTLGKGLERRKILVR